MPISPLDPTRNYLCVEVAKHRTDYNLYEGWQLKGFPVMVFLRGQKIVDHGNWYGKPVWENSCTGVKAKSWPEP